jgi:hypothetical protein
MASAGTTADVLVRAGFEDITLERCDIEITIGADLDEAVEFVMAIGPAGELIRLTGDEAEPHRASIIAALGEEFAALQGSEGTEVRAAASSWIVSARSP